MQKIIGISRLLKFLQVSLASALFFCISINAQFINADFSNYETRLSEKNNEQQVSVSDLAESEIQFAHQFKAKIEHIAQTDSKWFLDSAYQKLNDGYRFLDVHYYYYYGPDFILDSILGFTYDEMRQFTYNSEIQIFNRDGNLLLYVEKVPDFFYSDTSIIDHIRKEYTYNSGQLVRVKSTSEDLFNHDFLINTEIRYSYNDAGQLLTDSTFFLDDSSFYRANTYAYYPDGKRKYKYERYPDYTGLTKFTYEYTDSSLLRVVSEGSFQVPDTISLDKLTDFRLINKYFEVFNDAGLRKSLSHSSVNFYVSNNEEKDYQALYSYYEDGSIQQISYSNWEESGTEGRYYEYVRQKYFYNERGDILSYEQWFYDDRLMIWVMEEEVDYYFNEYAREVGVFHMASHELEVWPNPVSTELYLNIVADTEGMYAIYNTVGELVQQGKLKSNTIRLDNLPANTYYLVVKASGQLYTASIVKL